MVTIGTPKSATATKVVLCGSGELGKEFVIELQRYGVEVIALDKYPDAPAMQVAHRSYVVSMLDGDALREIIEKEKPDYIVPEVEAIATRTLMELEEEGYHVIPTARATWLTMNREGIRRLAAEELGLPTSPYRFAETEEEFKEAVKVIGMPCVVKPIMSSSGHGQSVVREEKDIDRAWQYAQEGGRAGAGKVIVEGFVVEAIATRTLMELEEEGYHVIPTARATWLTMNREGIRRLAAEELGLPTSPYRFAETEEEFKEAVKVIGMPCVVKPIMSSSGHGQSVVREEKDIDRAWQYAQEGGRAGAGKVIVEGFVDFDYEITQLTVRHIGGTSYLEPVGHVQVDGDYRESWQPQAMSLAAKAKAREIAGKITEALGGRGIFGVELFIKGDDVIFSEVSPRPHDTGMVTMITQDLSQFALHARAVLGLPIPNIAFHGAGASRAVVVEGDSDRLSLGNLDKVLEQPDTQMRFFGKPEVHGHRRMAVLLARGLDVTEAREKTGVMMERLDVKL